MAKNLKLDTTEYKNSNKELKSAAETELCSPVPRDSISSTTSSSDELVENLHKLLKAMDTYESLMETTIEDFDKICQTLEETEEEMTSAISNH